MLLTYLAALVTSAGKHIVYSVRPNAELRDSVCKKNMK